VTAGYDSREGIAAYLKDGLAGLSRLARDRAHAGYSRNERMQQWFVAGRFAMDTNGNTMLVIRANRPLPGLALYSEADPGLSWTGVLDFASSDDRCIYCGGSWDLETCWDIERTSKREPQHPACRVHAATVSQEEKFARMFHDAWFVVKHVRAVPNGYSGGDDAVPWFEIQTNKGTLVIGWRRSVINIDWSATKRDLSALFDAEPVTKGPHFIHAWGYLSAEDYIRRISLHLNDED
jgi:hypothetical protein